VRGPADSCEPPGIHGEPCEERAATTSRRAARRDHPSAGVRRADAAPNGPKDRRVSARAAAGPDGAERNAPAPPRVGFVRARREAGKTSARNRKAPSAGAARARSQANCPPEREPGAVARRLLSSSPKPDGSSEVTMRAPILALSLALLPACAEAVPERPPEPPAAPAIYVIGNLAQEGPASVAPVSAVGDEVGAAASRVLVTPDKHLDRPTEVVGALDFHTAATSEDKGFAELRAKATELGADAVIGAEFEHGEGREPSHLSGLAVRYR
jgi:hypothetical protein